MKIAVLAHHRKSDGHFEASRSPALAVGHPELVIMTEVGCGPSHSEDGPVP
jgi:hypothetical protein